jgi:hypothetical protein
LATDVLRLGFGFDGLEAEFRLQGKHFEDLGSLRKKLTFAVTCPLLNCGHTVSICTAANSPPNIVVAEMQANENV